MTPIHDAPAPDSRALPSLESVLCTDELSRRPARPPDHEMENRALQSLASALADSPRSILQTLADTILDVFESGSAGFSLLMEDGKSFHWRAIAGAWASHVGGETPRELSPCGDVVDRDSPLLLRHFERRYSDSLPAMPPAEECLLVPFHLDGRAVGTIWAIHHEGDPGRRKFDLEDLRMLVSLSSFASAAYRAVERASEFRNLARDHEETARSMREMNGALLVSSVRQHELTEQAQCAEAALRSSEVRYRRLFQSSNDGILLFDARTGRITDANAAMCDMIGLDASELLGKSLHEIGMFEDAQANAQALRELLSARHLRRDHLTLRPPRGAAVEVEWTASVYQEDRRMVAQCTVRDIAERALMERKILQQSEALTEQSRLKDEFLAVLSHELRNPLAPICSAVHLLKDPPLGWENPLQRHAFSVIERQVDHLTKLINDLLEVSRALSGRIRLERQPVDLNRVVRHAIETAAPFIEKRRHTLTLHLCSDPVWILADAARLEAVFVNLIDNAAKYTPDGGHIDVTTEHRIVDGENQARLVVRDDGLGLDPALVPRLFELFTQGDRSLARSAGGLGIGLSLAQRVVTMHGGTIEASSPGPGGGSEFTVKLPWIASPVPVAPVERSVAAESHDPGREGGVRLLLVDDNVDLVSMLSATLRNRGYVVRCAFTGPDGLKAAKEWLPDVALLDIGLPGLDGYDLARRLRTDVETSKIRLIALTGYGRDSDVALALDAGFDAHTVKPCDLDALERSMAVRTPRSGS